jgi:hypothetical protein
MRNDFEYDAFISFSHQDGLKVRQIYDKATKYGLRIFWSDKKLQPGLGFPDEIQHALKRSQHFTLYWTAHAAKSEWVNKEWQVFYNECHIHDKEHRRIYILLDGTIDLEETIPPLLKTFHRPKSTDNLVAELVKTMLNCPEEEYAKKISEIEAKATSLQNQLNQERRIVTEARDYYRHNRFWRPISENRHVHIFTCARDVPDDPNNRRGQGGRTNIDMWDYRSVLDITHFFASNFPISKVTIEDPMSKLHGVDLEQASRLADHIAHLRSKLEDKDCIIIGSPDVSDFTEIVLAELHRIVPYTEGRAKKKGFVITKARKYTSSSFYWEKKTDEPEGVAQILDPGRFEYFSNKLASENGTVGKMFGILIVANNPFCKAGLRRRIVILSGFSGVATNAIAKILTDDNCLGEFFKFDQAYVNIERPIEALIGVEYTLDGSFHERDTRKIDNPKNQITFEKLVEI